MVCIFPMVVVPILTQVEFGPNDHLERALHFNRIMKMANNSFDLDG